MEFISYSVNPFQENTYLIREGQRALLIDPGFSNESEFSTFQDQVDTLKINEITVLLTHAHIDHILGLNRVVECYKSDVYLHPDDQYFIDYFPQQAQMFGLYAEPITVDTKELKVDQILTINGFRFLNLFTPGHAPGHCSFYFEESETLVAGDTLFNRSIGRTDLYKGDFDLLSASIREKLYILPDQTKVLPGHGPATLIGEEKKYNPFVKI